MHSKGSVAGGASSRGNSKSGLRSWCKQKRDFMHSLGCNADFAPWTSATRGKSITLRGVPDTERDRSVLDCAWTARVQSSEWPDMNAARKGFYADTHDSVIRKPWGPLMALKQSQTIYTFELDYVLSGWAHMRLHGWSNATKVDGLTDVDLRSLAGESFALPSCTLVHYLYYRNPHASWWDDASASSSGIGSTQSSA
jgi:hypothetical protein